MRWLERLILFTALGGVAPIVGMLAGWWATIPLLTEQGVATAAMAGAAAGLLLDAFGLRRAVAWARSASLAWWAALYLFYSVGVFGMFMGVPVFNALLAAPAGMALAGRLVDSGLPPPRIRYAARRFRAFTSGVLALACGASASLALVDPYTADNLEGMLALPFQLTGEMIVGLILLGGAGLIAFEWFVAGAVLRGSWARMSRTA